MKSKKIIFFAALICVILALTAILCSCNAAKTRKFENNPFSALTKAYSRTSRGISPKNGFGKTVVQSLGTGNISLYLKSPTLLGSDSSIKGDLYLRDGGKSVIFQSDIQYSGYDLDVLLFSKDGEFTVSGKDLLGTDQAIFLKQDQLESEEMSQSIATMFGIDEETARSILDAISDSFWSEDDLDKVSLRKRRKYKKELESILGFEAVNGTAADMDGKEIPVIIVSYTLTNEKIKSIIDITKDTFPKLYGKLVEYISDGEDAEDVLNRFYENKQIDFKQTINVGKKKNKVISSVIDLTIAPKSGSSAKTYIYNITSTHSDTKTTVTWDASLPDKEHSNVKIKIKNNGDGGLAFDLTHWFLQKDKKQIIEKLLLTYNDSNGSIKIDLSQEESGKVTEFSILGETKVTDRDASITVKELCYGDISLRITLSLTFVKKSTAPKLPKDRKDVLTMTEQECLDFKKAFKESDFMKIADKLTKEK